MIDVIPLIGATLGAVVVTVVGFATDLPVGIACLVFFVIYQQVENYLIYPRDHAAVGGPSTRWPRCSPPCSGWRCWAWSAR